MYQPTDRYDNRRWEIPLTVAHENDRVRLRLGSNKSVVRPSQADVESNYCSRRTRVASEHYADCIARLTDGRTDVRTDERVTWDVLTPGCGNPRVTDAVSYHVRHGRTDGMVTPAGVVDIFHNYRTDRNVCHLHFSMSIHVRIKAFLSLFFCRYARHRVILIFRDIFCAFDAHTKPDEIDRATGCQLRSQTRSSG